MTGYGGKTETRYIQQIDSYLSYLHRSFDSNDKNDIKKILSELRTSENIYMS